MKNVRRVAAMTTVGAKIGKIMWHLGKEIYKLKQHLYKLKHQQIWREKSVTTFTQEKQQNTIEQVTKDDKIKTHRKSNANRTKGSLISSECYISKIKCENEL